MAGWREAGFVAAITAALGSVLWALMSPLWTLMSPGDQRRTPEVEPPGVETEEPGAGGGGAGGGGLAETEDNAAHGAEKASVAEVPPGCVELLGLGGVDICLLTTLG